MVFASSTQSDVKVGDKTAPHAKGIIKDRTLFVNEMNKKMRKGPG